MKRGYATLIANREHKHYPYDLETDFAPPVHRPVIKPIADGQQFDLGGRVVTAYECPGHTPGELVFIDDKSRILFCGDACNENLLIPKQIGVVAAHAALKRIQDMEGVTYDRDKVYNSHHDYRGFGAPLAPSVLPDAVTCMQQIIDGTATYVEVTDPLRPGQTKQVAMVGRTMITA